MESFVWLVVAASVLVLLQIVVIAYLLRTARGVDESGASSMDSTAEFGPDAESRDPHDGQRVFSLPLDDSKDDSTTSDRGPSTPGHSVDSEEPVVSCGSCGATNDPSYRFCRRCIQDLSDNSPPNGGVDKTKQLGS